MLKKCGIFGQKAFNFWPENGSNFVLKNAAILMQNVPKIAKNTTQENQILGKQSRRLLCPPARRRVGIPGHS